MKKEIFILLTASLVVSSCVDNEDIYKNPDNSKKDQVLTLSKYPQKVIDIETGSKHFALLTATPRSTFSLRIVFGRIKKVIHSYMKQMNTVQQPIQ